MLIDKRNFLFSRVTGRRKLRMYIFEKITEAKIKEAIEFPAFSKFILMSKLSARAPAATQPSRYLKGRNNG